LDPDNTGIKIFNPTYDEVIQAVKSAVQGESTSIATVLQTTSGNPGAVSVLTPRICRVEQDSIIGLARGKCRLEVSTTTSSDMLGTKRTISLAIARSGKSITCVKDNNKRKKLKVSGLKPVCPSGYSRP
jgi:hypothetical protein